MRTVVEFLKAAEEVTDRHVFVHDRRGRRVGEWTYRDLVGRARATGAHYLESGLEPGDHVFLQLPNSLELVEGFLGALLVGVVPCCLAPPRALGGIETFKERIRTLLEQFPGGKLVAQPDVGEAAGVPFLVPELGSGAPPAEAESPNSLAFIQLTSGSTKRPKAVRISHQALMTNVQGICASCQANRSDSVVSWLPLYHDMGLVGSLFCTFWMGADLYLLQPETFLARPRIWLQTISEVQGPVISIAPNFAFQTCVARIPADEVQGLDLSRWRLAGCGAEKVRAETLDDFAAHFGPAGFKKGSFVPCYGLAEATLAVTFGSGGRVPPVDDGNVSCGRPIPRTEVVIRDTQGNPLPEGEQGEITVKSESLCSGYAGSEENPIRKGWLHTGDRGYIRDAEVYVTGRYKDLIIVDGVNIDPDEIEVIAERTVAEAGARSGAFSVEVDGRERVVLVSETTPQSQAVLEAWNRQIGDGVARLFGFRLHDMVFVRRGALNKTSSGKVQRSRIRDLYERQLLEGIWAQEG